MAFPEFKTPLPKSQFGGINKSAKLVTEKREDVKKLVLENADSSASSVKALATTSMTTLKNTVSGLMPELPDTPTTSLQGEMSSLMSLNLSNPTAYASKLSSLESSFGTALSGKGKDLTSMVSDVQSSVDVSSLSSFDTDGLTKNLVKNVPNFEISGGSTDVLEKAKKTLTAQADAVKEDLSEISEDTTKQNEGTTTITADVSATQDKSKTEFNKQISTMTIKRSADGTTFTDNIKSELEVIDKDTFNTLLKDDNFDTHPAIVKFKFENLRQKTLSTDTFIANIKKEQEIDISKEQIDFQVRFNEPFYDFLAYIDNADTIIKKYRPTGIEDTEISGDKKSLSNKIRAVKAKKQALEKLYNEGGEWTEKILTDWESFITIEKSGAKTKLGTVKTRYTGN
jgi:hypothetical protein|tara:strand:+ start:4638 stop:5831 length:1194 start_codon:yes stop_codon:yes gene_type:complete